MEKREDRRDRTIRYGERARKTHLRVVHPSGVVDCVCERSAWKFAKGKAVGCSCRRVGRRTGPKVVFGGCHDGVRGYHPSVAERIAGKRLARAWLVAVRAGDADSSDL
jgi:hypothetical protein